MKKLTPIVFLLILGGWAAMAQSPILGTWKGTYGNGNSQTGNFYSLQFNADGSMNLLDPNGQVLAAGNCLVNNNSVTGTYYYGTAKSPYSIAGIYNQATNTITGTGGAGTATSGGFSWVMSSKVSGMKSLPAAGIPFGGKGTYTKAAPTVTQPATTTMTRKTTPVASGTEIGGVVNVFSSLSNTIPMADGTRLTITLLSGQTNLPTNLGGAVTEKEIIRTPMNSNDPSWKCQSVTKSFSATSNNFLDNDYSAISSTIFPGAIYSARDFLTGNRKPFEYGRNPIEIGVDNVLNTVGLTYRTVNQPTQNEISTAIGNIANTMNGSGEDIKYRVYISESDAEMALNAAAGGNFAGFSLDAAYKNNSRERVRVLTIDATKTYFTTTVNLPANGYFADKSIEQNNGNMFIIKNVIYGCRVLANVIIKNSSSQDEVNLMASYKGVGTDANLAFNYFKSHQNFESAVQALVIGGPAGTSIFNAATLREDIEALVRRANYRTARPISYTLTDLSGNILGIQSATDEITVPECVPNLSDYRLSKVTVDIKTGTDPKDQGSLAEFDLYTNTPDKKTAYNTYTSSAINIEFPTTTGFTGYSIDLSPVSSDPYGKNIADQVNGSYLDIFFTPKQIFAGWDEWNIKGITINMIFKDQFGTELPVKIEQANQNIWMRKNEQRLRIPFTILDPKNVNVGSPFMPTNQQPGQGTIGNIMEQIKNNTKN